MNFRIGIMLLCCLALVSCHFMDNSQPSELIVCLTFDDQDSSVYTQALPIMEEYGVRGTLFVNTGLLGNSGKMTASQVQELYHTYGWEIGGHSLNHDLLPSLDVQEAQHSITADWQNLFALGLNPQSFALPFGYCPQELFPVILAHYQYIRGSSDFPMQSPINPHGLGYLPWQQDWTHQSAQDRVLRGVANREALVIIGFHTFDLNTEGYEIDCNSGEFRKFIQWLSSHQIRVLPLREALEEIE